MTDPVVFTLDIRASNPCSNLIIYCLLPGFFRFHEFQPILLVLLNMTPYVLHTRDSNIIVVLLAVYCPCFIHNQRLMGVKSGQNIIERCAEVLPECTKDITQGCVDK